MDYVVQDNLFVSNGYTLYGNDDTAVYKQGVTKVSNWTVDSPSNPYAVSMYGNAKVDCFGTIACNVDAVRLQSATGSNPLLIVESGGLLSANRTGVYSDGAGTKVIANLGTIYGGQTGVFLNSGALTIVNTGTILTGDNSPALNAAIAVTSADSLLLVNAGVIKAGVATGDAYDSRKLAVDTVTNKGTMIGDVNLGGNNDVFNTQSGKVVGTIDGGAGNDTITGGAFADTMKGGTEADTFVFKTKADAKAIDHIGDFVHAQDHIALSKSLFKLDPGQSVASAFQDITGSATQGAHKHILYDHDSGFLSYDADGAGGANPIHFATLDTHPLLTSGDILMV